MFRLSSTTLITCVFLSILALPAYTQTDKYQIPKGFQKAYFEVTPGVIYYPFGSKQLEPGFELESLTIPPAAVRLVLAGYDVHPNLSAQITYLRPVLWVKYRYKNIISGKIDTRTVWNNTGGLTLKPHFDLNSKLSLYGEAGLAIITRCGFSDNDTKKEVVKDANFATWLFGTGLRYKLNEKWTLQLVGNYSPESKNRRQPYTAFIGGGFMYHFNSFAEEKLQQISSTGIQYPKNWIQIGYSTNALGYEVNNTIAYAPVPLFWGGACEARQGLAFTYQNNIFHGARVFALDWGTNFSYWQTNINRQEFFTFSLFPVFRINLLHSKPFDAYFFYSVAGPCFISKTLLDNQKMGGKFTFQDNMGTGLFLGENRRFNFECRIGHYSNGNLFTENEAVKIPLTFCLGYVLN